MIPASADTCIARCKDRLSALEFPLTSMRLSRLAVTSAIVLASCAWLAVFQRGAVVAPAAAPFVDYERDIQPIIKFYCLQCHSQDKRKGGLSLATYADVLEGGKDGPI